jgi:hypothetical protein
VLEPLGGHCLGGLAAARFVYTSLSTEGVCRKMPRDRCSNGGRSTSEYKKKKKKLWNGFWLQKIYQAHLCVPGMSVSSLNLFTIISSYGM